MVENLNIEIKHEETKQIIYYLDLDNDWWIYYEFDKNGKLTYFSDGLPFLNKDVS